MIRNILSTLLRSSSVHEARVVLYAEDHVTLASGTLKKHDVKGTFSVGEKQFLFSQIKRLTAGDTELILYFN